MEHKTLPPFSCFAGPRDAKLLFVGEAWGKGENEIKKPFVGASGKELFLMLGEAMPHVAPALHAEIVALHKYDLAWVRLREKWFEAASIAFTNTINLQPYGNKFDELCAPKAAVGKDYPYPSVAQGKYLRPEFLPELARLEEEILTVQPNLIVCLGGKSSWAILGNPQISKIRGACTSDRNGIKVLPTYHPSGVLQNWSWRPIVVGDLIKAEREMKFHELKRPSRQVLYSPTIEEVEQWTSETLASPPELMGSDTETARGQITMISFARKINDIICIPFVNKKEPGYSYWPSVELECRAWTCVAQLLERCAILWQNGLYDMQYVLPMSIATRADEDTMLLHHSLLPEMQKGLGFLGSAYTDEPSWKLMRTDKKDTEKRDE